jgi:hypothetical protein
MPNNASRSLVLGPGDPTGNSYTNNPKSNMSAPKYWLLSLFRVTMKYRMPKRTVPMQEIKNHRKVESLVAASQNVNNAYIRLGGISSTATTRA